MRKIMSSNKTDSFNRCHPLLERKRVPCELVLPSSGSNNNNSCPSLTRVRAIYTLRILQGYRSIPGGSGATERAIRVEISDEYTKCNDNELSNKDLNRVPNYQKDKVRYSPKESNIGLSHDTHKKIQIGPSALLSPFAVDRTPHTLSGSQQQSVHTKDYYNQCNSQLHHTPSSCNVVDPVDTINLYELNVGESDFADLRQDQALNVDFSNFAKSFIELLRLCDLGTDDENSSSSYHIGGDMHDSTIREDKQVVSSNPLLGCQLNADSGVIGHQTCNLNISQMDTFKPMTPNERTPSGSQYICRIEDYSSTSMTNKWNKNNAHNNPGKVAKFSIVESNQFRELTHLSLNLQPGTDTSVRLYLSVRLTETLGQNATLNFKLQRGKDEQNLSEKAYHDIAQRYNQLVEASETANHVLAQEAGETIHKEHARNCEELDNLKEKKEREIQELKDTSDILRIDLEKKVGALTKINEKLKKENVSIEESNSSLRNNLSSLESNVQDLKSELSSTKNDATEAHGDKTNLKQSLQQTQDQVKALSKKTETQERTITASEAEAQLSSKSALQYQHELESRGAQLSANKLELNTIKDDYHKMKDLLSRYQRDRQEMKRRMKAKVDMVQKQERVLSTNEVESSEMEQQCKVSEMEVERLNIDLISSQKELSNANDQLADNTRIMDNNQQVIAWLSKEVNGVGQGHDRKIGRYCTSSSALQNQYGRSSFGIDPHISGNTTTHPNLMYVTPELKAPNENMTTEIPTQRNDLDQMLSGYRRMQVPSSCSNYTTATAATTTVVADTSFPQNTSTTTASIIEPRRHVPRATNQH